MTEIGIILHFGLYSVYGFDDIKSLRRRKDATANGSEWLKARLDETGKYRPISGYKETQAFFKEKYPGKDYFDAKEEFDKATEKWDPDVWFRYFKSLAIDYVILSSKHHEGFCLFETKTTENKSKRDLVRLFIDAGRKYGIRVGLYYSLFEFGKSVTKDYLNNILLPQIEELRNYTVDMYFFDGIWEFKTQIANKTLKDISDKLKKDNPNVLINDRIVGGNYRNYADRYLPSKGEILEKGWEHVNTISKSWGFLSTQEDKDYKTGKELQSLYSQVQDAKGRFLLNLGPKANGEFDEREIKALNEFIELIDAPIE